MLNFLVGLLAGFILGLMLRKREEKE